MNFVHGLFTENIGPLVSRPLKKFFCIHKVLDLLCDSLHVLLVLVSFVVGDAVDSEINRLFDVLFWPIATH